MNQIVRVVVWPIKTVFTYVKSLNELLKAPLTIKEGSEKTFIFVTKITGATTGAAGAAKGSIDAAEAFACNDGVCFIVSCVGVAADSLQVLASLAPGPNVTSLVTTPISVGCKVFVWCCKRSKLPWGKC
jgi:hypothetical protein